MSKLTIDECKRIIMQGRKQLTAAEQRIVELEANNGSRWYELFGTPERAANILALGCMGALENVCDSCVFRECDGKLRKCESIHSIATQMLEWLESEASAI